VRTERVTGGSKKGIEKICGFSFYSSLFSRVSSKFYTYILLLFLLLLIYIIFFSPNNETVHFTHKHKEFTQTSHILHGIRAGSDSVTFLCATVLLPTAVEQNR